MGMAVTSSVHSYEPLQPSLRTPPCKSKKRRIVGEATERTRPRLEVVGTYLHGLAQHKAQRAKLQKVHNRAALGCLQASGGYPTVARRLGYHVHCRTRRQNAGRQLQDLGTTAANYQPQITRKAYSGVWLVLAASPKAWGQREYRSLSAGKHIMAMGGSVEQKEHHSESYSSRRRNQGGLGLQAELLPGTKPDSTRSHTPGGVAL